MEKQSREEQLAEIKSKISSMQRDISSLREKVNLSSLSDEMEDKKSLVSGLPLRLQKIRKDRYIFETNLEAQADDFNKRWMGIENEAKQAIRRESTSLKSKFRDFEMKMNQLES